MVKIDFDTFLHYSSTHNDRSDYYNSSALVRETIESGRMLSEVARYFDIEFRWRVVERLKVSDKNPDFSIFFDIRRSPIGVPLSNPNTYDRILSRSFGHDRILKVPSFWIDFDNLKYNMRKFRFEEKASQGAF